LEGIVGKLRASWNRHQGGVQTIRSTAAGAGPVRIATRVRIVKDGRSLLLQQEADPDPRLIICEEGPERIALRVMYSLIDEAGRYHGDGLTDTLLWADGEVRLAFALRLVDAAAHDTVTDASIEVAGTNKATRLLLGTERITRLACDSPSRPRVFRLKKSLPGRFAAIETKRGVTALAWYSDDGRATDEVSGVGLWHGPGDRAPYYDTWGHLYDQWQVLTGWAAHKNARLTIDEAGGTVRLAWHWLRNAAEPTGANFGLKAMLGMFFEKDFASARRRIRAFQTPIVPRVGGAQFRCLDLVENTLLLKKTAPQVTLAFPRDRLARTVHVRMFGLDEAGAVLVEADGRPLVAHLLSLGGMTDDPYGPHLARPADRFVPIVGDLAKGPYEVVFSVRLSPQRKTIVTVRQQPGIQLAYVKWDDRQTYVLRSSRTHPQPLAAFSTRTLCLHDLRSKATHEPALHRVPLYWYPANVQTRGQCLNELKRLRLSANGPDVVALRVIATNPNQRARSTVNVEIPASARSTVVDVTCRLDVLEGWDLDHIQYLNSFPSTSWQPQDWPDDWVIVMTPDGRTMQVFFKEPRDRQVLGDEIHTWRDRLFFAQGASQRGNLFILVQHRRPARQRHSYVLCPIWLDSHFSIENLRPPCKPGDSFEVRYTIGLAGDQRLSRAEAIELGKRSLASGKLSLT